MNSAVVLCADARALPLRDKSIQCCVTSPPYFNLRDYDVAGQIGQETQLSDYVSALTASLREVRRVLTDTGTCWLNIGDSYGPRGLFGTPWRLALALQDDGWFLMSDVIWQKTRGLPNGGKNRPMLFHEYLFMLTTRRTGYYYNADAIREPHSPVSLKRWADSPVAALGGTKSTGHKKAAPEGYRTKRVIPNPLGKLKASVWPICPSNYRGAHFATFPPKLVEPCILASSRPGDTVLDCFGGAGTTALVAQQHGRRGISVDLNPANGRLAQSRLSVAA